MSESSVHTTKILGQVADEVLRQDARFGEYRMHPWVSPGAMLTARRTNTELATYLGMPSEASVKAICDLRHRNGELTFYDILLEEFVEAINAPTGREIRAELIQVAAVAINAIRTLDKAEKILSVHLPEDIVLDNQG